jgi:hypothetical protein
MAVDPADVGPDDLLVPQGGTLLCYFDYQQVVVDANGDPVLDSNGQLQYAPFPLAGFDAHMKIRAKEDVESDQYFYANSLGTSTDGTITIDTTKPYGRRMLLRGKATVTPLIPKSGFYDFFLVKHTDPTEAYMVAQGKALLDKRVTDLP